MAQPNAVPKTKTDCLRGSLPQQETLDLYPLGTSSPVTTGGRVSVLDRCGVSAGSGLLFSGCNFRIFWICHSALSGNTVCTWCFVRKDGDCVRILCFSPVSLFPLCAHVFLENTVQFKLLQLHLWTTLNVAQNGSVLPHSRVGGEEVRRRGTMLGRAEEAVCGATFFGGVESMRGRLASAMRQGRKECSALLLDRIEAARSECRP
ncbi:hypothetical protein V5799_009208 [Amblyomma americanum]|uniref:Uncharacterized protein n=1 Tax=Amblyomma americanum TaxID=6943 RepID=A0AAQ4FB54_AMBAM